MRILLTANALTAPSGTSLYTQEIAESLQARGHEPFCFTLRPGALAQELSGRGIPVSDDLRALPQPDIIHGQHFIETTLAAITHRTVPVISFCHGPEAWQESACRMPNTVQYVAVDAACQRRLVEDEAIRSEQIQLLLNHYDDRRFRPRALLPDRPRRALMISNRLSPEDPVVRITATACRTRGIEFATVGARFGNRSTTLETLLPEADIVFAKARCAIEAMAVGCAVIQLDHIGAGRLITSGLFDEVRPLNFGYRSMVYPADLPHIGAQIDAYDPEDAAIVSTRIRAEAGLGANVDRLLELYRAAAATAPLQEYDPAIAATDFLRFQLFLSKLPFDRLTKTKGVPLRLPTQGVASGELGTTWERIAAQHRHSASGKPPTVTRRLAATLHRVIDRLLP